MMLTTLKVWSTKRSAWWLLIVSSCTLEVTALYFQHGMGLLPCVMCIYERVALFAILLAGIIGVIAPHIAPLRIAALLLAAYSGYQGLLLAIEHTHYQLYPAPWNQCSPFVNFPEILPLDQWLPSVFAPSGDCSKISWQFLGFSMAQWLMAIFAAYLLAFILLLLSQFEKTAK